MMFSLLAISIFFHISFGQYTLESNEFYVAFPRNGNYHTLQNPKIHITTTEDTAVTVTMTTSINSIDTVTVQPHTSTIVSISHTLIIISNTDTNKGIHVKAENDKKISVYATSYATISTAGGFAALPLHVYDDHYVPEYVYYAFSAETNQDNIKNEITGIIVLVAGANNTQVTITPTQNVTIPAQFASGSAPLPVTAGESITVTMNSMQTLLLNSIYDLSGSKVVSNKPLSVISGHECGVVPPIEDNCDNMVQQIPPSVTWGRRYMAMPFQTRTSGALFKIITNSPDNEVNITCNDVLYNNRTVTSVRLGAGQVYSHIISNNDWCSFISEYPMMIAQYAFGGEQEKYGDPMMIILTPLEQYTQLTNVVTPTTPLKQSIINNKQNLIGLLILNEPKNITLDDSTSLDSYNWTAVYDVNDDILGYGLSIQGLDETYHTLTSSGVMASVIVYGFSSEHNGFGYQVNGGLDPISLPWYVSFVEHNYTVTENEVLMVPVQSSNSFGGNVTVSVVPCQGTTQLDNVMFDNSITFTEANTVQFIKVIAIDDANIELEETMCLELVTPSNEQAFLYPVTQTTIFIKDDDRVHLTLTEAKITNEENDIELTLRLSGYEGETVGVSINASISDGTLNSDYTHFSSFTVYFTKYLTEVKYMIPLHHTHLVTDTSMILIQLPPTEHNITLSVSTVHLQQPTTTTSTTSSHYITSSTSATHQSLTTSSSLPQSTPVPIISRSSSFVSSSDTVLRPTTNSMIPTNTPLRPTGDVGGVQGGNTDTIELDPYIVYLIIGLVALLGLFVFMLIAAVACLYYRIRGSRSHVDDESQLKYLKKSAHTPSSAQLLAVTESSFESPTSRNRFSQDSAVYISSSSLGQADGNTTRSNSPNDENPPAINGERGGEAPAITNKILLKPVENSSSPSHSSLAGSNDNLLQQTTV